MCGRYATTRNAADLSAIFESYDETAGRLAADYNVAPTDAVPIVRVAAGPAGPSREPADASAAPTDTPAGSDDRRVLSVARWGLVPAWAKDARGAARMINARAETVATTNAYARSFAKRRCLVPADGWYEWVRREGGGKQPYFMTPRDGDVLAFAGLWSIWSGGGEPLLTCSVVTTAAIGELSLVHERMPLVLPRKRWSAWLAGGGEPTELLAPPSEETLAALEIRPVGRDVGDVRNDGPGLVDRVPATPLGAPSNDHVDLTLF